MVEFTSAYALLDVMKGRKKLAKRLAKDGPIHVMVEMTIEHPFGDDDGTSIEFVCTVHSITPA